MSIDPSRPGAHRRSSRLVAGAAACLATLMALPGQAAIVLPDVPLQVGSSVPPNIMFILDDSGSMQSEMLPDEIIQDVSKNPSGEARGVGIIAIGRVYPRLDGLYGCDDVDDCEYTNYVADPNNVYGMMVRTPTINRQYYNPAITYKPWVKADGTSYAAADTTCALWDPMDKDKGCVDLTKSKSYSDVYWQRSDSTHCPQAACVREDSSSSNTRSFAFNTYYTFSGDADVPAELWDSTKYTKVAVTDATKLQNFANWFQFYRSRMLASRGGIGRAFAALPSSTTGSPRVGFGAINKSGTIVKYVRPFTGTDRDAFYTELYERDVPDAGTPLRGALKDVGAYFDDKTGAENPWRTGVGASTNADYDEFLGCRQSFAMLMTDGYWNGDSSLDVGNVDTAAGYPFADSHGNTLADVAYKYWKDDMRTTVDNKVPTSALDPNNFQHMVTYGIGLGVFGQIDRDVAFGEIGKTSGTLSWPDPHEGSAGYVPANKIDDLLHASVNGRGGFFSAADPTEFVDGLSRVLNSIVARAGSSSNVTTSSVSLGTDTRLFQASYVSGTWVGELKALTLDDDGIGSTPVWLASEKMPAAASRTLVSWNGTKGIDFAWASLTEAQQTALGSEKVFDYLRGVRDDEKQNGGTLRNRSHLLGDIVHSSPAYSKDSGTLFVGGNDGMLHAFNAGTGVELFGYVPGGIDWTKFKTLADADYAHKYFVDGSVSVSSKTQTPAKNILAAALGRGGRGVFALDVTSPSSFSNTNVIWDKTGSAAPENMGNVIGRAFIGTVKDGKDLVTALIVPNGPNSTNDRAALFIYKLDDGTLIKEIDTEVGSASEPNGLMSPRGWDDDGDGAMDRIYAGDLRGNLWRFDISGNKSSWDKSTNKVVMFAAGSTKPITGSPSIGLDPATYAPWVFFGTGRYLVSGDPADKATQSFYAIKDSATAVAVDDLQQRKIVSTGTVSNKSIRRFQAAAALDDGKKGWYIDLLKPPASGTGDGTAQGERVVGEASVRGNALVFSSIIPSSDKCERGGTGFINAIDPYTGTRLGSFFDIDEDGRFLDDAGIGSVDLGNGMPTDTVFVRRPPPVAGSGGGTGGGIGDGDGDDDDESGGGEGGDDDDDDNGDDDGGDDGDDGSAGDDDDEDPPCVEGETCPENLPPGCGASEGLNGGNGESEQIPVNECTGGGRISWRELIND